MAVRARPQGPLHFRMEVEDNGIGIAADDLPRLFVEFQQLDAGYNKQHQGTGLGLALTRRLVEAQGGSVGVRSEPGRGSVFHLVLARDPGACARAGTAARDARRPPAGDRRRRRANSLRLAQRLARARAFSVEAAPRANEALHSGVARGLCRHHARLAAARRSVAWACWTRIRSEGLSHDAPGARRQRCAAEPGRAASLCDRRRAVQAAPQGGDRCGDDAACAGPMSATSRRTRVMVMDDDPLALDLMRATLEGHRHRRRCAWQDGRAGAA